MDMTACGRADLQEIDGENPATLRTEGSTSTLPHGFARGEAQSDINGNEVVTSTVRSRSSPYGEYRVTPSAGRTDKGFTGRAQNDEVALIYMRARYYVPGVGRFASADSIVPFVSNPQTLNRFSYCIGNPLVLTDPTGHYFSLEGRSDGLGFRTDTNGDIYWIIQGGSVFAPQEVTVANVELKAERGGNVYSFYNTERGMDLAYNYRTSVRTELFGSDELRGVLHLWKKAWAAAAAMAPDSVQALNDSVTSGTGSTGNTSCPSCSGGSSFDFTYSPSVQKHLAQGSDKYHGFPSLLDKYIINGAPVVVRSDGRQEYLAQGYVGDTYGVYHITLRSDGTIIHRLFTSQAQWGTEAAKNGLPSFDQIP